MRLVIRSTWNNLSSVITPERSQPRLVQTRSIINWLIMFNYGNNSGADKIGGYRENIAKIPYEIVCVR